MDRREVHQARRLAGSAVGRAPLPPWSRGPQPSNVDEGSYDGHLKLDFIAMPRRRGRQGRRLREGVPELLRSLYRCRTVQRPLPRLSPKTSRLFNLTGLRRVTCQQLRPTLGSLRELALKSFYNTGMKRAPRLAQKGAVGAS
jgi:hypothetical protein